MATPICIVLPWDPDIPDDAWQERMLKAELEQARRDKAEGRHGEVLWAKGRLLAWHARPELRHVLRLQVCNRYPLIKHCHRCLTYDLDHQLMCGVLLEECNG